jgi:hypothetical protein
MNGQGTGAQHLVHNANAAAAMLDRAADGIRASLVTIRESAGRFAGDQATRGEALRLASLRMEGLVSSCSSWAAALSRMASRMAAGGEPESLPNVLAFCRSVTDQLACGMREVAAIRDRLFGTRPSASPVAETQNNGSLRV